MVSFFQTAACPGCKCALEKNVQMLPGNNVLWGYSLWSILTPGHRYSLLRLTSTGLRNNEVDARYVAAIWFGCFAAGFWHNSFQQHLKLVGIKS